MAVAFGDAGINVHCLAPQGVRTPLVSVDARAESEVRASGTVLEPEAVADEVLAALRSGAFLILPHPEVRTFEAAKVADRDRWLANMRKLRARL
jgi:short-subunit dehydrogenase